MTRIAGFTPLETRPVAVAQRHLAPHGWMPGKRKP